MGGSSRCPTFVSCRSRSRVLRRTALTGTGKGLVRAGAELRSAVLLCHPAPVPPLGGLWRARSGAEGCDLLPALACGLESASEHLKRGRHAEPDRSARRRDNACRPVSSLAGRAACGGVAGRSLAAGLDRRLVPHVQLRRGRGGVRLSNGGKAGVSRQSPPQPSFPIALLTRSGDGALVEAERRPFLAYPAGR
jgi:hypothetical protein